MISESCVVVGRKFLDDYAGCCELIVHVHVSARASLVNEILWSSAVRLPVV